MFKINWTSEANQQRVAVVTGMVWGMLIGIIITLFVMAGI